MIELKDEKLPLKLDLQFFAEPGEGDVEDEGEGNGENDDDNKDKKTFTQSELDSEISKAVDSALKKREKKHQEELDSRITEALDKQAKLSKLSEKERKEVELTDREKQLEVKIAELERRELKGDAIAELAKLGYPQEYNEDLADILLREDAQTTLDAIQKFDKLTDSVVNLKVKEKLRQDTPPAGGGTLRVKQQSISEIAKENRKI